MIAKSVSAVVLGLAGLVLTASQTYAEEAKPSYNFQFSGIKYSSLTTSEKPKGGESSDVSKTELSTTGADSYAWVALGKWNFYLYPFQYSNTTVGLSYMLSDTLELGSLLALNSVGGDDKSAEETSTSISPFVTYYAELGPVTLENYLYVSTSQSKSKADEAGTLVDVKSNSTGFGLLVTAIYPLAKNFSLVPSVGYNMSSGDSEVGTEEKSNSSSGFSLTPIAIRTTFD
jgi:hypothetical protein